MPITLVGANGTPAGLAAVGVICTPEVEVRSGRSPAYFATGRLRQGETVAVRDQQDGWVGIVPPAGSFSWVKGLFIRRLGPQTAVVEEDNIDILVGDPTLNIPSRVRQLKAHRGLVVQLRGTPVKLDDGDWWPIHPPPSELRWIPADAVKVQATPAGDGSAGPTGDPAGMTGVDPLWGQATQLEQAGRLEDAERCYGQLLRQTSDPYVATRCQNRINSIQAQRRTAEVSRGNSVYYQSPVAPASRPDAVAPPSFTTTSSVRGTPPGAVVAPTGYSTASTAPVSPPMASPAASGSLPYTPPQTTFTPPPVSSPAPPPAVQPSGPGFLRRTVFYIDDRPAYALENERGQLRYYVTAAPGLNLELYVNRKVELFGQITYSGYTRNYHILTTYVNPLPHEGPVR